MWFYAMYVITGAGGSCLMNMGCQMQHGKTSLRLCPGVVLVEVLLAAGILGLLLSPLLNLLITGMESNWFASQEIKAQSLIYGQLEGLRSIRERNWNELAEGSYFVVENSGRWELVSSANGLTTGPFTVLTEIEPVYRNALDEIVAQTDPGAVADSSTFRTEVTVTWHVLRDRRLSVEAYLTRYLDNLSWTQTTLAQFNAGTQQYTETVTFGDGAVQLLGGCAENPQDGPLLFDELFYNTWVIHPSANKNIRVVDSTEGEVYEGDYALELSSFSGAETKLRNVGSVCTIGFTTFEYWAYSTAAIEQTFGLHGEWDKAFEPVTIPPQEWTFVSMPYADLSGGEEVNLDFIFFKPFADFLPGTILYFDNVRLSGGAGGYYLEGIFESSVFDPGRKVVFNRISHVTTLPSQTEIGFQVATGDSQTGPWVYYGPGGTTSLNDLYTNPAGEGIWLGNNYARFLRYRAVLRTGDGQGTPVLESVTINYSP